MEKDNIGESQNNKNRKRILIGALIILALCIGFVLFWTRNKSLMQRDVYSSQSTKNQELKKLEIKDELKKEVGSLELDIEEFFVDDVSGEELSFAGDVSHINLNKVGTYDIKIQHGDVIYKSKLVVEDTVKPEVEFQDLLKPFGAEVKAEDFVKSAKDKSKLTYEILSKIDTKSKEKQEVKVKVTDEGGNFVEGKVFLTFVNIKPSITVEAGTENNLKLEDFFEEGKVSSDYKLKTVLSQLIFNHVEKIPVVFTHKGAEVIAYVEVKDTVAPKAEARAVTTFVGIMPKAEEFVTNIVDATDVNVTFVNQPNVNNTGKSAVTVELTDEGGNSIRVESTLTVMQDEEPPVIYGAYDFTYYPGERSLTANVSVGDNIDPNPSLSVDKSKVNEAKAGTYPLTYIARDRAGNESRVTIRVTVKLRIPYEPKGNTGNAELNQLADAILRSIINGEMNQYEQAYSIFNWVRYNISYKAQNNRTNLVAGALAGLKQRSGDCYIYRFTNQALLTRAGISNYGTNSDTGSHAWAMATIGGRSFISDALWGYFDVPLSVVRQRLNQFESGHFDNTHSNTKIQMETEEEKIPFETKTKDNPNEYVGYRKTLQAGQEGVKQKMYQVTYKDGKEVSRDFVSENIVTKAIEEIVEVGTKVKSKPKITWIGADTINIKEGESINLLSDVSAVDTTYNISLKVTVDAPSFDKAGTYTVTYRAKAKDGSEVSRDRLVVVSARETTTTTTTGTTNTTTTTSQPTTSTTTTSTSKTETEAPKPTATPSPTPTPEVTESPVDGESVDAESGQD